MFEDICLKRTYASFLFVLDVPLGGYLTGLSQIEQSQVSKKRWFEFSLQTESYLQRVFSFSPEKRKILLGLKDSDEAGCELQKIKKGKIDYIVEAKTTIKKKKQ